MGAGSCSKKSIVTDCNFVPLYQRKECTILLRVNKINHFSIFYAQWKQPNNLKYFELFPHNFLNNWFSTLNLTEKLCCPVVRVGNPKAEIMQTKNLSPSCPGRFFKDFFHRFSLVLKDKNKIFEVRSKKTLNFRFVSQMYYITHIFKDVVGIS